MSVHLNVKMQRVQDYTEYNLHAMTLFFVPRAVISGNWATARVPALPDQYIQLSLSPARFVA